MKILERQLYSVCVLQCVVVCCSVLQCVVVCCSVLQCCIVYVRSTLGTELNRLVGNVRRCWSVLQRVAVCRSVVQCVSVRCTCPTANWVPSWLLRNIRHFCCSWYFWMPLQHRWNFSKISYTVCVYSKFNTELTFEIFLSFLLLMTCLCGAADISRNAAVKSVYTVKWIPSWLWRNVCDFCEFSSILLLMTCFCGAAENSPNSAVYTVNWIQTWIWRIFLSLLLPMIFSDTSGLLLKILESQMCVVCACNKLNTELTFEKLSSMLLLVLGCLYVADKNSLC